MNRPDSLEACHRDWMETLHRTAAKQAALTEAARAALVQTKAIVDRYEPQVDALAREMDRLFDAYAAAENAAEPPESLDRRVEELQALMARWNAIIAEWGEAVAEREQAQRDRAREGAAVEAEHAIEVAVLEARRGALRGVPWPTA